MPPLAHPSELGNRDLACLQSSYHALRRSLGRISERERHVVQLYYDQELTMKEIGEKLGIDESRVCQLHSALARLRLCVERFLNHPHPRDP